MDNQKLQKILEEIKKKEKMDFADIAASTGFNRSYLSRFLNDKEKRDVTNQMFRKFQDAFPIYFTEGNESNAGGNQTFQQKYLSTIENRLKEMEEDKKFLQRILETNLAGLVNGQQIMQAQLRTIHQWDAIKDAESKAKRPADLKKLIDEATEKLHRLLASNLQPAETVGKTKPVRM